MDSENRIINQLSRILSIATDELLISISNKGTVNRAKKDLEKQREHIFLSESETGEITAAIGEEATVTFSENLTDCKCTCPSSSICRHIITAILYGAEYLKALEQSENSNSESAEKKEYTSLDFPELNAVTFEELKKLTGKKDYASFVASIRKKNEAEFQYGELLQVFLKSQNTTVYFPQTASISGAVCSCKEKKFCRHKGYALTAYLLQERGKDLPLEDETAKIGKTEQELLEFVMEQMKSYLEKGMSSLTEEVIRETQRVYIRAYGRKLYRLAEEEKLLSGEFASYFSRNVNFSNTRTLHLICKIYNRAFLLLDMKDEKKKNLLIGKRREESLQIEELPLFGLGAVQRLTKRNDLLVSVYFYCPDFKEILILSTLRPVENNLEALADYLFQAGLLWKEEFSIQSICSAKLSVKGAVITSGRISGTKNTSAEVLGETTEEEIKKFALLSFHSLREQLRKNSYQYFAPYYEAASVHLVKIKETGECTYDSVKQRLTILVIDDVGEELLMEIRYSEASKKAIARLEKQEAGLNFTYLLGSFTEQNGKLSGILLAGFSGGRIVNLYFDVL